MSAIKKFGKKINEKKFGIILGIVLPFIAILVLWQWKLSERSFASFMRFMSKGSNNDFLIFPLIPNLLLFYFTNFRLKWERFSAGLVMVTVLLAITATILIIL